MPRGSHQLGNQVASLIKHAGVQLPTGVGQPTLTRMVPNSGVDFDRKFVSAQLEHVRDDVRRFQLEEAKVQDQGLRQLITGTLPMLRRRLERLQKLAASLDLPAGTTPP